jgi:hypothetical protein
MRPPMTVQELAVVIHPQEELALGRLSAEDLEMQLEARWTLHDYAEEVWRRAQESGRCTEWKAWKDLMDLLTVLFHNAHTAESRRACGDAGTPPSEPQTRVPSPRRSATSGSAPSVRAAVTPAGPQQSTASKQG